MTELSSCHPLCPAPGLRLESTTDALCVAGRPRLHWVLNWYNLVAALAAGGVPFCG
jgi:hypothetical protein